VEQFQNRLVDEAPAAAHIDALSVQMIPASGRFCFVIEASDPLTRPIVRLPRDLATCPQCRFEIFEQQNRRYGYPFTNCTDCGPRYSIIEVMACGTGKGE
jgi:hydrogenase maturation protein HypF